MKKKFLMLMLLVGSLALVGCSKDEPTTNVNTIVTEQQGVSETEPDVNIVYAAEDEAEPVPTEVPEPTDTAATEDVVEEEEPVVLYAKTYKQVYPELYNFYPENPAYKYSQWVFTIDSASTFIGSITLPDGTIIVGGGSPGKEDTSIDIPSGDYTGGNRPSGVVGGNSGDSTQGGGDNPSTGPIFDVVVGDEKTNPSGVDYYLSGDPGEDGVDITTKTIKDAKEVANRATAYSYEFKVKDVQYIIESLTTKAATNALKGGLYNEDGQVFEDESKTVITSKGTYRLYYVELSDGTTKEYAATYKPTYSTGSVYMLTTTDLEDNQDLIVTLQLLVVE